MLKRELWFRYTTTNLTYSWQTWQRQRSETIWRKFCKFILITAGLERFLSMSFLDFHVSDRLPETDKDCTRRAAISEKVLMLLPHVQTRAHQSTRWIKLQQNIDLLLSSLVYCNLPFKKKTTKMFFFALLCSYIVKKKKKKHIPCLSLIEK